MLARIAPRSVAVVLAPIAAAGTNPHVPTSIGQHVSTSDGVDTTNGLVDLPF